MIAAEKVPCFRLTTIFRQAQESLIVRFAHQINHGEMPYIDSPFKKPEIWQNAADCLFLDSDEATREQLKLDGSGVGCPLLCFEEIEGVVVGWRLKKISRLLVVGGVGEVWLDDNGITTGEKFLLAYLPRRT